ncbi:reverse transcriptase domain-containing protein [Tanacetum coccineum]|uniref:Reverse transcriptase domain-containing protein n=1 Tax=Tanacetum coccineum TaxID=301880 RepID=A0ABQ4X2R6_9ASTR
MMQVATSFLQGQEAASNQERKKVPPAWRHQEGGHRQNFKKGGGFRSQHKQEKRPDRFTLLTKTPKEILALEKGKFKTPPPMTTPVEKRNANKFCEFHGEVGHNTDECNHLRKQIEDMLKAGKLSHIIRELKQSHDRGNRQKHSYLWFTAPEETRGHIVYLAAIKQLALSGGIDWMSKAKQLRKRQRRTMTKEKPGRCRSYFSHPDDSAKEEEPLSAQWTLFTDGSSCVDGCGAGVILTDLEGIEFTYALRFQFEATNNEAEYEALIAGLQIAEKMGVQNLEVKVDSKLVANQVNGTYVAKEYDMIKYLEKIKSLSSTFRRSQNKASPKKQEQALSKMASTSFAHLSKQVLVEGLKEKSVNKSEVLAVVEEEGDSWMSPIHEYLTE